LPALASQARKSGIARHVGRGLNIWSNVHIDDVAELYLLALEKAPAGSFLFAENGEASFREMVGAISERLGTGAAQPWPVEDAVKEWGFERAVYALGSNSRVRGRQTRALTGWAPQHESVLAWISSELETSYT
jgi:nucleoside-diphosphate-sugar epimerase